MFDPMLEISPPVKKIRKSRDAIARTDRGHILVESPSSMTPKLGQRAIRVGGALKCSDRTRVMNESACWARWRCEELAVVALLVAATACSAGSSSTARSPSTRAGTTEVTGASTPVTPTSIVATTTVHDVVALPDATRFPAILTAGDGVGVRSVQPGATHLLIKDPHVHLAYRLRDGSIVTQTGDAAASATSFLALARWYPGGKVVAFRQYADAELVGVGFAQGHDVLLLVPTSKSETEPLTLYDVATGAVRTLGFGAGPDSSTSRASIGAKVVVQSESLDLGEGIGYTNLDGTPATGWPDLAKGLPYPSYDLTSAVVSPDGSRIAYLDGPPANASGPDPSVPWQLVVVSRTGIELVRVSLVPGEGVGTYLDFDGRWALISRQSGAAMIIDTTNAHHRLEQIPGADGVATLDRPH